MMDRLTPERIRKIRGKLGCSRRQFGRILCAASTTVDQWESGECSPVGMHQRLLVLLERGLRSATFRAALRDPRASDPMYLLYRLLEPLYENRVRGQP